MNNNKWVLLEYRSDFWEVDLKDILNELQLIYRAVVDNIAFFEKENKPSNEEISKLKELIDQRLGSEEGWNDDGEENYLISELECDEIIFDLTIMNQVDEERFIDVLQTKGNVSEYAPEYHHFDKLEYCEHSDVPIVHDIRLRNIAIYQTDMMHGICFIGYMKRGEAIQVRIKTFQFDILKIVLDVLKSEFNEVVMNGNVEWMRLLSRKFSSGYRTTDSFISENALMKQFLKTTKSTDLAENMQFLLEKLCDKGYLDETEYDKISKDKNIVKFLLPF